MNTRHGRLVVRACANYDWPSANLGLAGTSDVTTPLAASEIKRRVQTAGDFLANLLFLGLIGFARLLPYRWRLRFMSTVMHYVAAPLAGWHKRVRANLALVWPELTRSEARRITRNVADTFGRMLVELYSPRELIAQGRSASLSGPGLEALKSARAAGRPVVLVTGHFGNFMILSPAVAQMDMEIGVLYRRQTNRFFNPHYVDALRSVNKQLFEESKRGMVQMVKYLQKGGMIGILTDVRVPRAPRLDFLGQPAETSTVPAELALKHDAALIPIYAIRKPDGESFDVVVDAEIPHTDPVTMTKTANQSLARMVEQHPGQWFWVHRRWK